MSRNSSISVSDAKRFLRWLAVAGGVALALSVATIAAGVSIRRNTMEFETLVNHQADKIEAMKRAGAVPDTVFLGDSSLGNGIDARIWSQLSGQTAQNLALTSYFAYSGDLNFLRRILAIGRPRNVVIMHIADTALARERSEANVMTEDPAVISTAERLRLWWRLSMNLRQLSQSFTTIRKWAAWKLGGKYPFDEDRTVIADDYVLQGPPYRLPPDPPPFDPIRIAPDRFVYLDELASLCRAESLNCLFLFGPLADPVCSSSGPFFDAVADRIQQGGLIIASRRPRCMAPEEIGDAENHVRPELRAAFTRDYFTLLSPLLRRGTP